MVFGYGWNFGIRCIWRPLYLASPRAWAKQKAKLPIGGGETSSRDPTSEHAPKLTELGNSRCTYFQHGKNNGHLFPSGMWLGEDLRTDTEATRGWKRWTTCQDMLTVLGSVVNMIGGILHSHVMNKDIFIVIMNKMFRWALRIMRQMATSTIWVW
jgi:hypothetical protein